MYKKLLVPVVLGHEPNISAALQAARALCDPGGEIILLHVIEEVPEFISSQIPRDVIDTSRAEIETAMKGIAASAGAGVTPVVISGHASRSIVDYGTEHGVDCIVIASHRPGLQDYFIGSTAARVVRHAGCSVHVIR